MGKPFYKHQLLHHTGSDVFTSLDNSGQLDVEARHPKPIS